MAFFRCVTIQSNSDDIFLREKTWRYIFEETKFGQPPSKHLNGRSEAACLSVILSVSDSIILDQKVKIIKACIFIRPEAPKLIRPDVH